MYNFDSIFTGTRDEQWCKASHFLRGLSCLIREEEKDYADAIISGAGTTEVLFRIHQREEAQRAFADDPRAQELQRWVDEQAREEQAREFAAHLMHRNAVKQ